MMMMMAMVWVEAIIYLHLSKVTNLSKVTSLTQYAVNKCSCHFLVCVSIEDGGGESEANEQELPTTEAKG